MSLEQSISLLCDRVSALEGRAATVERCVRDLSVHSTVLSEKIVALERQYDAILGDIINLYHEIGVGLKKLIEDNARYLASIATRPPGEPPHSS